MVDISEGTNYATELTVERFDEVQAIADDSIEATNLYVAELVALLDELVVPSYDAVSVIATPSLDPIDYSARPSFTAALESFPAFGNISPPDPALVTVPDIDTDVSMDNVEFTENSYESPTVSIGDAPTNDVTIDSIDFPTAPSIVMPDTINLAGITIPAAPDISISEFTATLQDITEQSTPSAFSYTAGAYNSDIRADLFAKILYDIANGGTGLDATVESDIYARGTARQQAENEALYREAESRFTAVGFELPTGALVSSLQAVSNEISRKTDQLNREITINQAELAQKNTQFTIDQARQLEMILVDFYNSQEGRTLEASKAIAQSSIDIYNTVIANQKLKLEKYQVEATVFELKIKAEMTAAEIYRTKMEGVKLEVDVQRVLIDVYNAQLAGIDILLKLYTTEMESVKIHTEVQMLKVEVFKAEIEAYIATIESEKLRVDIYGTQIESEKTRAAAYGERVQAAATKVEAAKTTAEVQQMNAENILKSNQLKITEFAALLDKYKAEIEYEIKTAQLEVEAFKTEAMVFEAESNAQGMEYTAKINEGNLKVEEFKARIAEQIEIINATKDGYIALKTLQEKGTEGIMNVNAQLAASAMNAVNASAGISSGSSYSYD